MPGASRAVLCCVACVGRSGRESSGGKAGEGRDASTGATASGSLDAPTERPRSPPPPLPAAWIGLESSSLFLERDGRGSEKERERVQTASTHNTLAHSPTHSLGRCRWRANGGTVTEGGGEQRERRLRMDGEKTIIPPIHTKKKKRTTV